MQHVATVNRNQLIAAAAGTLDILEILGAAQEPTALHCVVAASGRPKGTVHRMLSTLVNTGFATYCRKSRRYTLTRKTWSIGCAALPEFGLLERASPILGELRAQTCETVHISILEPSCDIVYLSKLTSPNSITGQTRLGQLAPAWCTATGRAILAFRQSAANHVLTGVLERRTAKTITDPVAIMRILNTVRRSGYSVTYAENHPEMGGVAAPIRNSSGVVIASIGAALPVYRMTDYAVKVITPLVREAARLVSRSLGHEDDSLSGQRAR